MKVTYLEICGFRAFGALPQRLEFESPLAVIHADNSQGKTSLAESFEFLMTGATTRRLLLGGSPSEFEDSLRNAHLAQGQTVYVEVGLKDSGRSFVLRRELIGDYRGASDCASRLTLDGRDCPGVSAAGLRLSDPPLAAPVLLEHTLRYVVSAKPGERSDYFKALLEVADLDIVRNEVAALITELEGAPRHALLKMLGELALIPMFAGFLEPIRLTTDVTEIEESLRGACQAAATADPETESGESLSQAAARLHRALEARQLNVLPVGELSSAAPATPTFGSNFEGSGQDDEDSAFNLAMQVLSTLASDYASQVAAVDTATADVLPLLRVALQTDRVTSVDVDHPTECPLCLTPDAITADRVTAIRRHISDKQQLGEAAGQLKQRLEEIAGEVQAVGRTCLRAIPVAHRWSDEYRQAHLDTAVRLGAERGLLERLLGSVDALADLQAKVDSAQRDVETKLRDMSDEVERVQTVTPQGVNSLVDALRNLNSEVATLVTSHARVVASTKVFVDIVGPALESGTDTSGWATLLGITKQVPGVAEALVHHGRHSLALSRLRAAFKDLEAASQRVVDQRLVSMGDEVRRWWNLLRPDELTAFGDISRRGKGKRYLDVTAALAPHLESTSVVRNALAVFSNSQLNALGLSAFLARCTLMDTPFLLLDDPIPGSDREHRSTFASAVVGALLDDGRHVIVTTHDSELARHLHASHQHLGVDEFEAVLSDPRDGTQVVRTGDDFERLMLDAGGQMHSPLASNRRAAGNCLRIAAERLAKHVTVAGRRRAGDASAAISDCDNKNLKDLRPLAVNYAVRPNEPGQWQLLARILNNADHDTLDPPLPSDLKLCHTMLRQLKKQHKQQDQNLMRP